MEITRAITWDDTKRKGLTQAITWDDTKRRKLLGSFLCLAIATLMLQAPISSHPIPAAGQGPMVAVIVQAGAGATTAAERAIVAGGGTVSRELGFINSVSARIPAGAAAALRSNPSVVSVVEDGKLRPQGLPEVLPYSDLTDSASLRNVRASIGANRLNAAGVTGRGVGVALIDTGVTPVGGLDGAGKVINGIDVSFDSGLPGLHSLDLYGHGTHLAGIIAGHDLGADPAHPAAGQFLGVAPDATILNVKAGDQRGAVDVSQIIAAIGWVIDHRFDHNLNVRVLNLSYGTDSTQSYQVDPLAQAAEAAWKAGIVVVASAGNDGATLMMHLGVTLAAAVFGRAGRSNQGGVDHRAGLEHQAPGRQCAFGVRHRSHNIRAQLHSRRRRAHCTSETPGSLTGNASSLVSHPITHARPTPPDHLVGRPHTRRLRSTTLT